MDRVNDIYLAIRDEANGQRKAHDYILDAFTADDVRSIERAAERIEDNKPDGQLTDDAPAHIVDGIKRYRRQLKLIRQHVARAYDAFTEGGPKVARLKVEKAEDGSKLYRVRYEDKPQTAALTRALKALESAHKESPEDTRIAVALWLDGLEDVDGAE